MKKVLTKLKSISKKTIATFAVIATVLGIAGYVNVNAGEAPEHHKSVTSNGDGTYKISLDVTGKADTTSTDAKANILIVYDVSGSMNDNDSYVYEKNTTGRYGKVGRNYVQLYTRSGSGWNASYNQINNDTTTATNLYYAGSGWNNYIQYTGTDRYVKTSKKRSQVTEKVMYDFADALYKNNKTADATNVQMALITFSGPTQANQAGAVGNATIKKTSDNKIWTSDKNTFLSYFSSTGNANDLKQSYGGGTNWDAAFRRVKEVLQSSETDSDPTYVIFVTDGGPTSRVGGGNGYTIAYDNYNAATANARFAQTYNTDHTTTDKSNTVVYGIYAYGTQGDYLDDLIYYAQNGSDRAGMDLDTDATTNYYDASDTTSLNQAVNDIFEAIVKTLGVGNATVTDGTTQNVKASSGDMNYKLLSVDTESYEYWLSMSVTSGENGTYTMQRMNLATAKPYTLTIAKKDSSCTAELCEYNVTWEGHEEPVTVLGNIQNGKFKYKWTESNDLYKYNPPAAELNSDGEVIWDLTPVDRLLNEVTYSVTFDVWPSQETLDLIADIKNGLKDYSSLDANVKEYLKCNAAKVCTLYTNTEASLSYDDTRDNSQGNILYTDRLDPVPTEASEMEIEKLWNNIFNDSYSQNEYAEKGVTFKVLKDNDKNNPYDITVLKPNAAGRWLQTEFISAGVIQIKNGKALIRETGHDYTFAETPQELDYHWDLLVETVRPMIINGSLTTLVKVEENAPTIGETNFLVDANTNTTYYKIGDSVYYVREQDAAILKATNVRRSNLNITKEVTGEGPEDSEFTFVLKVKDYNGENLWFSIYDPKSGTVKDDSFVTIDNPEVNLIEKETDDEGNFNGFYEVKSETKLTVKLKADWNLRFTNLPIGSSYEFEETAMPENFKYDLSTGSVATIQTNILPVGAVANGDGTYTYTDTTGKKTIYTEIKDSQNKVTGYTYPADVTRQSSQVSEKISGNIYTGNTVYTVKYTNEYELTNLKVNKTWTDADNQDGKRPASITVKLYQDGTLYDTTTLTSDNAVVNEDGSKNDNEWTYTFNELPKFDPNNDNKEYEYTITEDAVTDYTTTYDDKVSVELIARPATETEVINVTLLANDEATDTTITLNKENKFKATITDLAYLDDDNKMITYTVSTESDTPVKLYTKDKTIDVTNNHDPEKINIPVEKVWDDADNQDGVRPTSVTINLLADGEEIDNVTLTIADAIGETEAEITAGNKWGHTFEDLFKYSEGSEIKYTIVEDAIDASKKYTAKYSDKTDEETGLKTLIVTNTHTPEVITISGTKTWVDGGNTTIMPESITIKILADGVELTDLAKTVTADDNWAYSFTDLPKYKNGGTEIKYTIDEALVPGYKKTISGNNITNTLEAIDIPVEKVWDDASNQDGVRPDTITIRLLANNVEVAYYDLTAADVSGNTNTWAHTFNNLNKYDKEGKEITYTIVEDAIDASKKYSVDYTSKKNEETGVVTQVVTNTHTPEVITISGTKTWVDGGNTTIMPNSISVKIFADGAELTDLAKTVTADDNWAYSFTDLPKYKNGGTEIKYTIDEAPVPGYKKTVSGNNITNTLEAIDIPVEKVWDDASNQDGVRPDTITIRLLANGTEVAHYDLTAADVSGNTNTWAHTFNNLNKYDKEGKEITYTIVEDTIDASKKYTATVEGYTITNEHIPEVITISGTKTWVDGGNTTIMPKSITVKILADGVELTDLAKTVTADDNWSYSFTNLPKYKNGGTEIKYTIDEVAVPGYKKTVSGNNITNTLEAIDIPVEKTWDDASDQDGARPDTITIRLLANGTEVAHYDLTSKNALTNNTDKWTYTFENLNKYDKAGKEITYTITEDEVNKYTTTISGYNVTNKYTPEVTSVSGTKTWVDGGNTTIMPKSITVKILADGVELTDLAKTVTADDNWSYSFTNLPKYKNGGNEIKYTIDEVAVPGYTKEVKGNNITNTLITTEIPVEKVWEDANNQDGVRPDTITIRLLANGTEVDHVDLTAENAESANKWTYTFKNLNKYDTKGNEVTYTVTEDAIETSRAYSAAYAEIDNTETGITTHMVTNTHKPGETSVTITKVWDDANNQDGVRPDTITIRLLADGAEVKHIDLTTEHVKEGNANEWTYTFAGLPKYNSGKLINYTVTEDAIAASKKYTATVDGYTITNKHIPEVTEVSGTKTWNDANNQDGKRPGTITINLLADGKQVQSKTVSGTGNEWTYSFQGLPKYKNGGVKIEYTITETPVPEYTTKIDGNNITNTHTPETTYVEGKKVWKDDNNLEGYRPESITVRLLANNVEVDTVQVTEKTKNDAGEWLYSFTNLPKYSGGELIKYTVKEDQVANYDAPAYDDENPYIIINTHQTTELKVVVNKKWVETSAEGIKDEFGHVDTIEVRLEGKVNDNVYYNETQPITAGEDGNWTYEFTNLPEYREGQKVIYTAYEITNVNEYSVSTEKDNNIITITNTYTPGKTDISGEKIWDDADNQDGIRPESITIKLLADGEEFRSTTVTAEDNWAYSFTNLPKNHDGKEIEYTLEEVSVDGYTSTIDKAEYNITNTHTPETVSFYINKIWEDNDDNDGKRPESIMVRLLANGTEVDYRKVTPKTILNENGEEVEDWSCEFTNLPKYNAGAPITYTIVEDNVKSYETEIILITPEEETNEYEYEIINTHEAETTEIEITKVWDDVDDAAMIRPEEIKVDILANGVLYDTITINATDDNWVKTITGLPKWLNGEPIVYTIEEHVIAEYDATYAGSMEEGFTITNKHELGRGGDEELPPQTGITTRNYKTFIYLILILLNILGTNIIFIKNE